MLLITTATTTDGQLNPQNKQMVQITAPFFFFTYQQYNKHNIHRRLYPLGISGKLPVYQHI